MHVSWQALLYMRAHTNNTNTSTRTNQSSDALALGGIDYLVVSPKVLLSLSETPTLQGYNDGLHAGPDTDGYAAPLTPQRAKVCVRAMINTTLHITSTQQHLMLFSHHHHHQPQETEFSPTELETVTERHFKEQLGLAATELLAQGLNSLRDDADRLDPVFEGRLAFGAD